MQKYLLIIPRHAERHSKIVKFFRISKFSRCQKLHGIDESGVDVCLVDTTGEFQMLTQIADIAFIGKNLSPNVCGQSPLDAFCCGVPIVYGSNMTNFCDICLSLENNNKYVVKVGDESREKGTISTLAKDSSKRTILSENLKKWHKNNCSASTLQKDVRDCMIGEMNWHNMLSGRQNDTIEFVCKLRDRTKFNRYQMFLTKAYLDLGRAIRCNISIDTKFFYRDFKKSGEQEDVLSASEEAGISICEVSHDVFEKIINQDN